MARFGTNNQIFISNTGIFDASSGKSAHVDAAITFVPLGSTLQNWPSCECVIFCFRRPLQSHPFCHKHARRWYTGHFMRRGPGCAAVSQGQNEGLGDASSVDLLSIDEGVEADALQCISWDVLNMRAILIEANKQEQEWVHEPIHIRAN
eukprot:5861710-Pleurochrysis_carterae.AAC.1